jgi:hypothetical protein
MMSYVVLVLPLEQDWKVPCKQGKQEGWMPSKCNNLSTAMLSDSTAGVYRGLCLKLSNITRNNDPVHCAS